VTRRPSVRTLAVEADAPPVAVFAAIDVGANAARLQIGRRLGDGSIETLHCDRCPVRPGAEVFTTQAIAADTEERLTAALGRFHAACDGLGASARRAVATSAFRQAVNAPEVVARLAASTGVHLEVISAREEARLICRGALAGTPRRMASLVVDVGGGSTEVVVARGAVPLLFWSLALGSLRLGATAGDLEAWRKRVRSELAQASLGGLRSGFSRVIATSGTLRAVVRFASGGQRHTTRAHVGRAVRELVSLGATGRAIFFDASRADTVLPGAVILDELLACLQVDRVEIAARGLRDGVIAELAGVDGSDPLSPVRGGEG
jgi:exopolyphosphatase / guanosine-5'-triphosphate,3'-diphosphate pyrophosphatase